MWKKLSDDGSIHDKDTTYTWTNAFATKVAALNGGGGFAGYTDWRVPNRNELESLVNVGAVNPAVFPAFNTSCAPACTVLICSCTASNIRDLISQIVGSWLRPIYLPAIEETSCSRAPDTRRGPSAIRR